MRQAFCVGIVMAATTWGLAAEKAKLVKSPAMLSPAATNNAASAKGARTKLLRPARIAVADEEPAPLPAEPAMDPRLQGQKSKTKRRTTIAADSTETPSPNTVEISETPEPVASPMHSSRRTATGAVSTLPRIGFHPVEVVPVAPDRMNPVKAAPRNEKSLVDAYRSAKERALDEPYEPVVISGDPMTAEYEEEVIAVVPAQQKTQRLAPLVSDEEQEPAPIISADSGSDDSEENLAPIISAADLPRPGTAVAAASPAANSAPPSAVDPAPAPNPTPSAASTASRLKRSLFGDRKFPEFSLPLFQR